MPLSESLAFEISTTQAQLDRLEAERKKLKKKLKTLNTFLAEFTEAKTATEQEIENHD